MTSNTQSRGLNALFDWYRSTTPQRRRRIGVSLVVVCVVMLFTGNILSDTEVKTAREVEFENYSVAFENAAIEGTLNPEQVPSIRLVVQSGQPEQGRTFVIQKEHRDVVLRILVLMREARLFSFPDRSQARDAHDHVLDFSVNGATHSFNGVFVRSQLSGNVKAETLLKLISLKADQASDKGEKDEKS